MRLLFISLTLVTVSTLYAAQKTKDDGDEPLVPVAVVKLERKEPIVYENDIEPVLDNKCTFCHSGSVKEGKFDMGEYGSLMKGGKRGAAIVPGKPAESLLVKLAGKSEKPAMPPKEEEPLTPEELALIKLWIEQ